MVQSANDCKQKIKTQEREKNKEELGTSRTITHANKLDADKSLLMSKLCLQPSKSLTQKTRQLRKPENQKASKVTLACN